MSSSRRTDPSSSVHGADGLDAHADLHAGLDRELDLAAERPWVADTAPSRGPGILVASIVAGSLTLAGSIMLVRGQSEPETTASRPVEDRTASATAMVEETMPDDAEVPAPEPASTVAAVDPTHARTSIPGPVALRTDEIGATEPSPRSTAVPEPEPAAPASTAPSPDPQPVPAGPSTAPSSKPASAPSPTPAATKPSMRPPTPADPHPRGEEPRLPGTPLTSPTGPTGPTSPGHPLPGIDDPESSDDDAPAEVDEDEDEAEAEAEAEASPDAAIDDAAIDDAVSTRERSTPKVETTPSTETPERNRAPAPATPAESPAANRSPGAGPPPVSPDRARPSADAEPPTR